MHRHDISEPDIVGISTMFKCSDISYEYRKFMKTVERGTSKHYLVPLPFPKHQLLWHQPSPLTEIKTLNVH